MMARAYDRGDRNGGNRVCELFHCSELFPLLKMGPGGFGRPGRVEKDKCGARFLPAYQACLGCPLVMADMLLLMKMMKMMMTMLLHGKDYFNVCEVTV